MDTLKLIPRLFFDLISRVVPGSVAIVMLAAALKQQPALPGGDPLPGDGPHGRLGRDPRGCAGLYLSPTGVGQPNRSSQPKHRGAHPEHLGRHPPARR